MLPAFITTQRLDLQAKVILILIAVILPVSFLLNLAQSRLMNPLLHEELRQVGLSFSQNLASQIESNRLLAKTDSSKLIEDRIQRMVYAQPSVIRVDVYSQAPSLNGIPNNSLVYIASSVEDTEKNTPPIASLVELPVSEMGTEEGLPVWSILYPVKVGSAKANIHVLVSLKLVAAIQSTILKINFVGALFSTILLIALLSFFLKRAIVSEKQLKVAQMSNEVLSGKLQEIQQELIHKEKLAVMGQLTASFAHEIGTPLNAMSGHIQLLNMDLEKSLSATLLKPINDRIEIISGQLKKIESVVKGFLKTTKTPVSEQRVLTSVHEILDRVLALLMPTLQRHQISYGHEYLAKKDLVEVVSIEIEQVVLNLINNAIDSMKGLSQANALWLRTLNDHDGQNVWIEVKDTGSGITEDHLKRIFKPFFTTKAIGEGHGLGLSICQDIVRSYGGEIVVESKVDQGATIRVRLPLKLKSGSSA